MEEQLALVADQSAILRTYLLVAVIPALLALVGVVISAWFQYKGAKADKKAKKEEEEANELKEANEQLEELKRAQEHKETQDKLDDLRDQMLQLGQRLDQISSTFNERLTASEESITMIVGILSKDARTMSSMMRMHSQTENRLQVLMEMESLNMKFSNETSTTLRAIGEIMADALLDPDDAKKLTDKIEENSRAHSAFTDQIITSQKRFFDQPIVQMDTTAEKDIEQIEAIMQHKQKQQQK